MTLVNEVHIHNCVLVLIAFSASIIAFQVTMSCCEIYNETITDLLAPRKKKVLPLPVCRDKRTGFFVKGLKKAKCTSSSGTLKYIDRALKHRHSRAHLMNDQSSRSHCLLTLYFESREKPGNGQNPKHRRCRNTHLKRGTVSLGPTCGT